MFSRRLTAAFIAALVLLGARPSGAADQLYFSAHTNVTNILVQYINQENVRLDISSWYLSEHSISIAIANRFAAGVPVRIIGDRGAIFEADPNTRKEYYWLASQGIPIRLRFNPTWFPEIDHWKAAIFVGQNVVEFGSGNYSPTELAPNSSTDYDDDSEMFTSDPELVAAFKMKFDRMWNDTTVEPQSILSGPPYLKDWNDACANEPTGNCDFHTQYPNPSPMIINTARLEPDAPIPPDLIFGQGAEFNNRLTQEINNEQTAVDIVVYRLGVDNITQALLSKFQSGVPVRVIVDRNQYTNNLFPEYWLTHANVDKLWAAGIPVVQNNHQGVTHLKTLITSAYATNASSNFSPNWQRDHDYFVSALTKPAIYQAFKNEFQSMWTNTTGFGPLVTTPPNQAEIVSPASGASGVPVTASLVWKRASWAVSFDVYLGTSPSSMNFVGNVPAQLVPNPPDTYSFTPSSPLQPGVTYFWKVVSRTFANMTASTSNQSFTTSASGGSSLPSPWLNQDIGSVGLAGSSSFNAGVFTISGAGSDIWGSADSFQFAFQALAGDGQIVARVTGMQNTSANAKAGLMFRSSSSATAANVILDLNPNGNIEFMVRASDGGSTTWLTGATHAAPVWLRLVRSGSSVTGSMSDNGSTWTTIGTATVALGGSASVGLAVTSHNTSQLNTSTFDAVAVTASGGGSAPGTPSAPSPANGATGVATNPTLTWSSSGATSYDVKFGTANPPPTVTTSQSAASYTPSTLSANTTYFWQIVARNGVGTTNGPVWSFTTAAAAGLPTPWQNQDVGSVGINGSSAFSGGVFTVRGAGGDIWGSADGFQFAYQSFTGDGQIVARVLSMQNTNSNAKAGLMFRGTLTAGSAHVILDVEPNGNIEFMTRSASGGQTSWLAGAVDPVPVWLKLVRSGSTMTGFVSPDGTTWTTVGSTTITLPSSANVGLVVTSHDTSQLNTATFDQAAVTTTGPPSAPGTPASPAPASGATGVSTSPTLTWTSSGATSFDVKFGTANPPPQVTTGQTAASYTPATLSPNTTYRWQIVARNSAGTTTGPVWSFTTAATATPTDIVIYAGDIPASARHGSWTTATDATSPGSTKLVTPDNGVANTSNALASPTDYVDVTFTANSGTPYTIWLRLKALNNTKPNDSVWVQFSDARSGGSPIYAMNTTSGLLVNLATDSTGSSLQNWGWANGAYWLSQPTTVTFAAGGTHTLRIQVREDGVQLDQIVLSPATYLNSPPGPATNDSTIVPKP